MYLGNLGETMRRLLATIFCLFGSLQAEVQDLKQGVLDTLPSLEGWCSREKAIAFIDMVLTEKPKVWVEIGVFGGSSLFPVLSAFKFLNEGTAIGIDAWDKIECIRYFDPVRDKVDLKWWGNLNINKIHDSFQSMLSLHDLKKYCKVLRLTSEAASKEVKETIDVLYIDGNHSETVSTRDVELYLPKVRSGGYIWINDSLWPSRQKAVERVAEECDYINVIDNGNCILFKKR
jgi:hypothetical protein